MKILGRCYLKFLGKYINLKCFFVIMKVKKCPKCKSMNLEFGNSMLNDEVWCIDCGYKGMIVLEEEAKDAASQKS